MQRAEKVIEIRAPLERVFDLFSDFESFPRWMRHIREVRYTGRGFSRWVADAPLGTSVEWEAETTHFEPDHRIAWRSVRGDVDTEGEVIFEQTRRGTTMMRVVMGYNPPAGRLGAMVAGLFGKDPERQLAEDLQRFAEVVEGRRRRSDARRVERAGDDDRPRRRDYSLEGRGDSREGARASRDDGNDWREGGPAQERREYVREQLERRRRAAYDERLGLSRRDERGGYDPRFREHEERNARGEAFRGSEALRERDERHDDGGYSLRERNERRGDWPVQEQHRVPYGGDFDEEGEGRDYDAEEGRRARGDERQRRAEFDAALREARRSQIESMRRYQEERERTERERAEHERAERERGSARRERERPGRGRDERERQARFQERPEGSYGRRARDDDQDDERADSPQTSRHAMTPRERELERARRRMDDEYSRQAFRRGVDRLMDEPPSRQWRRWDRED